MRPTPWAVLFSLCFVGQLFPDADARQGMATWHIFRRNVACPGSFGTTRIFAFNARLFARNKAKCGMCARVTGEKGFVVVRLVDLCSGPACKDIDLSKDAFNLISNLKDGVINITYSELAPCGEFRRSNTWVSISEKDTDEENCEKGDCRDDVEEVEEVPTPGPLEFAVADAPSAVADESTVTTTPPHITTSAEPPGKLGFTAARDADTPVLSGPSADVAAASVLSAESSSSANETAVLAIDDRGTSETARSATAATPAPLAAVFPIMASASFIARYI